jgi:protein AIR1/2
VVADFLPRGGSFSETPLEVDPDDTSSSGSSSDAGDHSDEDAPGKPAANPHAGSTAPAISWNQGKKAAVRTTLGKRKAQPSTGTASQFNAVNDTYWRTRSASVSSGASDAAEDAAEDAADQDKVGEDSELEEGEVDSKSESDGSVSSNSEADDSILLNLGAKNANDSTPAEALLADGANTDAITNGQTNGSEKMLDKSGLAESKENAFQHFSRKYPTAPIALVDLIQKDFQEQAAYVHWALDINDIDLQLPVVCIECQGPGHLAEVCPTKEVYRSHFPFPDNMLTN